MQKLRVGYILDDSLQSSIVWNLIERSKNAKHYAIEVLIIQRTFRAQPDSRIGRLIDHLKRRDLKTLIKRVGFGLISSFEKFVVLRSSKHKDFYDKYSLEKIDIEKLYVEPIVSKSGLVYRYSEGDLEKIRQKGLDILIRGGGGILRGDILNVCRYGIVSFHHANNNVNRGGPPGFWEVLNREPSTGFVIQRLLTELDGGDVLFEGAIATSPLYVLNLINLYKKANVFLHLTLEKIGLVGHLPPVHPKRPYSYPLYRLPSAFHQLRYTLGAAFRLFTQVFRRARGRSYRWGVAYQFVESWRKAVLWRSVRIKNPPNRFLADPFLVFKEGSHICFMEDYDYRSSKGKITAFELSAKGYREIGTALEEEFHLSYPFIFEEAGEIFMCPETHQAREIRIYKCVKFPLSWKLYKVLMKDVSAADTSIFRHENKWWMLTNIDSSGLGDHSSELHLYYADTYDSEDWTPHPLNPVIFDSTRARNGGLLTDDDGLYRVFQVQGFNMYGESLGISRITELTTESYKEEPLYSIPPKFFGDICGTHTYSFNQGVLVFDFVKIERYAI